MNSLLTLRIHPQTCQLHFVDPQAYKDKLARAVRSLYQPMGVTVSAEILSMDALPAVDYSQDWGICQITLAGISDPETRTIRNIAGRVFVELMKSVSTHTH